MEDPAKILFLHVYRRTRSPEAAILELKRLGWDQHHTTTVVAELFGVEWSLAKQTVSDSLAWQ